MDVSRDRRLRRILALVLVLLLAADAILGAALARRHMFAEAVQEGTGVRFPDGVNGLRVARGAAALRQGWLSGYCRLPAAEVRPFMALYGFKPLDTPDLSFVFGLDRLPARAQEVKNPAAVWGLTGFTRTDYPFEMVLDARTGELWFNVVYGL